MDAQITDQKQQLRKIMRWRKNNHVYDLLKFRIKKCRLRKFDFVKLDYLPNFDVKKVIASSTGKTLSRIKSH